MMIMKLLPSFPFHVEFEVISACNLNCVYCYAQPFSGAIPSIDTLGKFFAKTEAEANPFEVLLAGGEPFLRTDILDVIALAKRTFKGIVTISTNGTLIQELSETKLGRLKKLVDDGVTLQVSFDSVKPEINDGLRGKTHATLKGLNILEKNKVPFTINMIATKNNIMDLLESAKYLTNKYGEMRLLGVQPLYPTVKTVRNDTYTRLSPDQEKLNYVSSAIGKLRSESRKKNIIITDNVERSRGVKTALLASYALKTCTAGLTQAGVFVNGEVAPCLSLRNTILGNLHEESWKAIWTKSLKRYCSLDMNVEQCRRINMPHIH